VQDGYAGDIGDYFKLGLLRAISPGYKLGVGWYRTTIVGQNGDGRHTEYLHESEQDKWSKFDPDLYFGLKKLVHDEHGRSIRALEHGAFLSDVTYHDAVVGTREHRRIWFEGLKATFNDRDLVFVDPDNGVEPGLLNSGRPASPKSITYEEVWHLGFPGRPMVNYHHQSRFKGGHPAEIDFIGAQLRARREGVCVAAIRARPRSPRVFFLVGFDQQLWARAQAFAAHWQPHATFHVIAGPPDSMGLAPDYPYSEWAEERELAFQRYIDGGGMDEYIGAAGKDARDG